MVATVLIAGATGNTGRGVVETLPSLLKGSEYRILALTRSLDNPVAQKLAGYQNVKVLEKNWVEITADWIRENEVTRAFIASHVDPAQFAEESGFLVAALQAGVEYVVRISTTAPNVRADCPAFYARNHWAIETLLSSPEFSELQWTSLQANSFSQFYLLPAAEYIKKFRKTGIQPSPLKLTASKDAPVGIIDPTEVGIFAAHLLAQNDISPHNKAKYVLNGPEDITGSQIVSMVEQHIGAPVEEVIYKDTSFVDFFYDPTSGQSKNIVMSIKHAPVILWEGKCSTATTSKEVLKLAPPKRTPSDILNDLLQSEK
jgi:uncharacterized protein YbjT (DUF2867 family)